MALAEKINNTTDSVGMRSARGRMPSGKPNPVDVHVGNRVRLRRTLLGMSQEKLGESLGLTFQQVQKYERGANRIGASRLWDLSRVLDCPVAFFFEEMDQQTASASPRNLSVETPDLEPREGDQMTKRETLELVRAYYKIRDYHVRRRIYELAKSLATTEDIAPE
jgi:transcriptional regulator with XRE-family HTH domain